MTKKTYSEKLKDPRWQKKRLEILQSDDFTCQFCGDTKTTLHVHHFVYKGDPWEADSEDMTTVCEDCHFILHQKKYLNRRELFLIDMIHQWQGSKVDYNKYSRKDLVGTLEVYDKFHIMKIKEIAKLLRNG